MTNLKINSTSTPYWCVVVPVDAEPKVTVYWLMFKTTESHMAAIFLPFPNMELLGCITSSGMDEGVREVCYLLPYKTFQDAALWILEHNQITLTADTKAVVIKQKL